MDRLRSCSPFMYTINTKEPQNITIFMYFSKSPVSRQTPVATSRSAVLMEQGNETQSRSFEKSNDSNLSWTTLMSVLSDGIIPKDSDFEARNLTPRVKIDKNRDLVTHGLRSKVYKIHWSLDGDNGTETGSVKVTLTLSPMAIKVMEIPPEASRLERDKRLEVRSIVDCAIPFD